MPSQYGITLELGHPPPDEYDRYFTPLDEWRVLAPGDYNAQSDESLAELHGDSWGGQGCDAIHAYYQSEVGASDYGRTRLTLRVADPAQDYDITGVRAVIDEELPEPQAGVEVSCFSSGADPNMGIDDRLTYVLVLDARDPELRYVADQYSADHPVEAVFNAEASRAPRGWRQTAGGLSEYLLVGRSFGCHCRWHVEVQVDSDSTEPTWYRLPDPAGRSIMTAGELLVPANYWTLRTTPEETEAIDLGADGFRESCVAGEVAGGCVSARYGIDSG